MPAIDCKFYKLHIPSDHVLDVLRELTVLNFFEPETPAKNQNINTFTEYKLEIENKHSQLLNTIEKISKEEYSDLETLNDKVNQTVSDLNEVFDAVKQIGYVHDKGFMVKEALNEAKQKLDDFEIFKNIDLNINFSEEDLVHSTIIEINNDAFKDLAERVLTLEDVTLTKIATSDDNTLALIGYIKTERPSIDQIINEAEAVEMKDIQDFNSPKEFYKNLEKNVKELETKVKDNDKKLNALTEKYIEKIIVAENLFGWELEALANIKYLRRNDEKKYSIKGWFNVSKIDELKNVFAEISDRIKLEETLPRSKKSATRSVLKNNSAFKPFEIITKLMGVPSNEEIDPTVVTSFFFIPLFGLALGDGGYGLILAAVAAYQIFIKKIKGITKDAFMLVLYCGLSTIFFGAITGSWFGADLSKFDGPFAATLTSLKLFDFQSSIIPLLVAIFVVGLVQQLVGLILKITAHVKNGEISDAILGPGTWILIILSIIGYAAQQQIGVTVPDWFMLLVVFVFAYGQGRDHKKVYLRPIIGLGSLFNLTGYLSNTLSYARIVALGLATGVIAGVINLLATTFGGSGIIGIIVTVIILLIGHTFNILLNVLGTFINVTRLQLVEFYPTFFEAKGRELDPLSHELKHLEYTSKLSKSLRSLINYV